MFVVALAVRVAFVWGQTRFQWFDMPFVANDSTLYHEIAAHLLHGDGFMAYNRLTAFVTPGYPLFLAALYGLGITTPLAIGLVQAVLGALTCLLVGRIAARLAEPASPAGVLAGLLAALYPHFVFWTGYLLTETLFVFLTVAALAALVRLAAMPSMGLAVAGGALLGAAALARPVVLAFALVVPLWIAWGVGGAPRRRLGLAAALVAGLLLTLGPWTVRNMLVLGAPVVTSTESGVVFYQGNSPGATGGSRGYVDTADYTPLVVPPGLSEVQVDRYHWRRAFAFIVANPGRMPGLFLRKQINMWRPTYTGASTRNWVVLGGSYLVLLAAGALGIARAVPAIRRSPAVSLLVVFIAVFVAQHGTVTGMIRFRLPVEAVLAIFGGLSAELGLRALGRVVGAPRHVVAR